MANGYELLKDEMYMRGLTKQQVEGKVATVVLSILSEDIGKYRVSEEELKEVAGLVATMRRKLAKMQEDYDDKKALLEKLQEELLEAHGKVADKVMGEIADTKKYVDEFYDALNECETAEGRDKLKLAQMFINSVNVETKYDNTAFIIGLSALMSGEKLPAVSTLKKINPKLDMDRIEVERGVSEEIQAYKPLKTLRY